MAEAFKSIMSKKIAEPAIDAPKQVETDAVLSKYKKKSRDLDSQIATEEAEVKKRHAKEQARLLGRVLPTKAEAEHEREL